MITTEQIKETIDFFKKQGYVIRVRDLAYIVLSDFFEDKYTAYQCLFGADGYDEYVAAKERAEIGDYMRMQGYIDNKSNNAEGLTFEENKKEMERLLQKIEDGMADGSIDPAVGLKTQADIRVKLNDKFKIEKQNVERSITVQPKFNFVCPKTHLECYQLNKEYAMSHFNLKEK